jgi:hypothetical protein
LSFKEALYMDDVTYAAALALARKGKLQPIAVVPVVQPTRPPTGAETGTTSRNIPPPAAAPRTQTRARDMTEDDYQSALARLGVKSPRR